MHLVDSNFDTVLMALFCPVIRKDSVSLLRFPFLSFASLSLQVSIQLFFFPFLFSGYFCSVDECVVNIVSVGCNQSFFALFYVVFELLYRCIDGIFNAGESCSSFFSWHIQICLLHLLGVMLYASSLVYLFSGSFDEVVHSSTLRMVFYAF